VKLMIVELFTFLMRSTLLYLLVEP
jgi:hypothetical protein